MASTTAETPHTVLPPLDFHFSVQPFKTRAQAGATFDRMARFVMRRAGREELSPAERRDRTRERRAYVRCCVGLAYKPKSLALLRRQAVAVGRMARGERVTMPAPVVSRPVVPGRVVRPAPRRRRLAVRSSARSGDSDDDSDSDPAWPRRIAARLSLRLADLAGHQALLVVMRADAARRGWSS